MNFFTYNGQSSADFGLHIESKNVFSAPAFDATFQAIPGRNGDLIISNNRFANASVSFTAFVAHRTIQSLADTLRAIRGWLFAEPDRYHPITDSYDTGFVRYGVIKEGLDIEEQLNRIGSFTVNFSCKPFRYSEAGNESVSVATSGEVLNNPFLFTSRPYLRITGSGEGALTIQSAGSNRTWTFSDIDGYVEADSEQMNFYKDTLLKNDTVTGSGFPLLYPGDNTLSFSGGITSLAVTPRWCTL